MSKKIESAVQSVAKPIVEALGYELYDVEYIKKKGAESELVIYIEKEGGIGLSDCEEVSRALDAPMDEADPIPDSYVLCVSSVGIDRPLKKDKDFERTYGKLVDIKFYAQQEDKKNLTGTLISHDEQEVIIMVEEKRTAISRKNIALIRPHLDF